MTLEEARKIKVGDRVSCPPDRGDAGYRGVVEAVFGEVIGGMTQYIPFVVRHSLEGHKSVWPSTRLWKGLASV